MMESPIEKNPKLVSSGFSVDDTTRALAGAGNISHKKLSVNDDRRGSATLIESTCSLLYAPDQVVEMRILHTNKGTVSGYYTDFARLSRDVVAWNRRGAAVYGTLNPVLPALLSRATNHLIDYAKNTTNDADIVTRRWILIDLDSKRPAGISSTNEEHEAALDRARDCLTWLRDLGFTSYLFADSGNGAHILLRIDLPNDKASADLVKRCLEAVALHFSDPAVEVDLSVFNAARICKLYGTLSCKGDNTPERPHRLSQILEVSEAGDPAASNLLEKLAALAPEDPQPTKAKKPGKGAFNLDEWIGHHNLNVVGPYPWMQGRKWIFPSCPFNVDHTNRAAVLLQFGSGAIGFRCLHNGCTGNDWHALRTLLEPGWQPKSTAGGQHQDSDTGTADPHPSGAAHVPIDLPKLEVTANLTEMVDAAENALIQNFPKPVLYQRARIICRIAPAGEPPKWLQRPPDTPIIVRADTISLREYSGQSGQWVKYDKRAKEWLPVLPPAVVFEALAARSTWKFPHLEGIIGAPTLRPDGVLVHKPGYDKETGLYLDLNGVHFPPVPDTPTREDAKAALDILYDPFADFPFQDDCHRAAALAGVLTVVGRFAIPGNVPAFVARAHAKGSGKGLLVNTIATIGTGRTAPTWTQTLDEAEESKRLLSIALAGDAVMHIDNITKPFGSAKLDSALTTATVKDRLLGANINQEAPWLTVIFASGNNLTFVGDMVRRVVPINLDPKVEHPEERTDFRHAPLLEWVHTKRPRLVTAALTALKAFFHAGCPKQPNVSEFGSFEQWSNIIRHSLIWAGFPDPCGGRKHLEEESDTSYEALATLLRCWADCYPDTKARLTLKVITQDVERRQIPDPSTITPANEWNALHDALSAYDTKYDGKRLDTKRIGNALRTIEGRILDNQRLIRAGESQKVALWKRELLK